MEGFKYSDNSPKEQQRIFQLVHRFTDELVLIGASEEEKWRAYYIFLDPEVKLGNETELTLKLAEKMQELSDQGVPLNVIAEAIEDTKFSKEQIDEAIKNVKEYLDKIDKKIGD